MIGVSIRIERVDLVSVLRVGEACSGDGVFNVFWLYLVVVLSLR